VRQNDFNYRILDAQAHRPWPMPTGPWVMRQTWHHLLFAHWPLDAHSLRERIPAGLELDSYHGQAWLGIVPFHMTNVAPRGVPALPRVSAFPELNVRTYVRLEGKPGVYFFSLDATNPLAVWTAWSLFHLPYYTAAMTVATSGEHVRYASRRRSGQRPRFIAEYWPTAEPHPPAPGSLEAFLTERYCLYAEDSASRLHRLEIHHPPWPLQRAAARIAENTMAAAAGLTLPDCRPLLHYSRRQDMVAWLHHRAGVSAEKMGELGRA
jgi:uncharacterized protein YqjF (DUF2071 family)